MNMQTLTSDSLAHALHQAEAQQYKEALATIRATKEAGPQNVYILAIEKQLTKLAEFTDPSTTSEEETHETFELLQILVDKALDGGEHREPPSPDPPRSKNEPATQAAPPKGERDNAVAVMKKQYLSRADSFLRRGDYQGALLEVRRIYVLDPENQTARDYEERVQGLLSQRSSGAPRERAPERAIEPLVVQPPLMIWKETRPVTESKSEIVREAPLHRPHVPASSEPELASRIPWKKVMSIALVVALTGSSAIYILSKKSSDEKLMARFTEHQSPSPVLAEKGKESQAAKQTAVKVAQPKPASTESTIPASTPKQTARTSSTPLTNANGKEAAHGNSVPSQMPATVVKPSEPTVSEGKPETQEDSKPKSVEAPTPQALTPVDPKPLSYSTYRAESQLPVDQFVLVQKEPQLLRLEKIRFPQEIIRRGFEGEVVVHVKISAEGKPLESKVLRSSNQALDAAVLEAVMNSEYSPGVMSTGPVTTWATIPFKFKK
jgi:TonB family protein